MPFWYICLCCKACRAVICLSTFTTGQLRIREITFLTSFFLRGRVLSRIHITVLFLAVSVFLIVCINVFDNLSQNRKVESVGGTSVNCVQSKESDTIELQTPLTVTGDDGDIIVRGLIFTACPDPTLTVDQKFLNTAYEVAKEVVYQQYEAKSLKTTLEVNNSAGIALMYYIQGFPTIKEG